MSDTSDGIDLATKIAGPATDYPAAYDAARDVWSGFIGDPTAEMDDYNDAVATHITILEKHDVPVDERTDVIVASFWAASAEHVINKRGQDAHRSEDMIRQALERVWSTAYGK